MWRGYCRCPHLTLSPAITAYNNGMMFRFVTRGISEHRGGDLGRQWLGRNHHQLNGAALSAGALAANTVYTVLYYNSIFHLFGQSAGSSGGVPRRQTVLSSSVDSDGLPNFITAGSGLSAAIAATTTPIVLTAANGYGPAGQVDLVGRISADTTISSLTGAQTVSSITRSGSTATVTTGSAHNLVTGAEITMSGATQTEYNVTAIVTVTGSTTFTYTVAGTPVTPATGSPSIRSPISYMATSRPVGPSPWAGPSASRLPGGRDLQHDRQPVHLQRQGDGRKVGNGSAAAQTYRVYIGDVQCSTSAVTSQRNYA